MKRLWIIIGVCIVLFAVGAGVFFIQWKAPSVVSPEVVVPKSVTPEAQKLLTWVDPAGFTFQYPEGIEINKHDEDIENYAHVELTQKNNVGTIIIWAKDTAAADSAGWVKREKNLAGGTVFDTSLGGISGKKILIVSPKKSVVSGVVDAGIVFYVEGSFDGSDFWTKVYDIITTSFQFSGPASESQDSAVDEEEIIE